MNTLGVFSGGGGKGLCKLAGAISALDDAGIRMDVVSGTSAGGLAAIAYALGLSGRNLSAVLTSLPENAIKCHRTLWKLRLRGPWKVSSIHDPMNARAAIAKVTQGRTREYLSVPCHVWGVDIGTGEKVDLLDPQHRATLDTAALATMSAPPFLPAVRVGGRWIIDGGVRYNLPLLPTWRDYDRVVILNVAGEYRGDPRRDVVSTVVNAMRIMLAEQTTEPLEDFTLHQGIMAGKVAIINLPDDAPGGLLDLKHDLIGKSYALTRQQIPTAWRKA